MLYFYIKIKFGSMMKKIIAILCVSFSFLVGCSKEKKQDEKTGPGHITLSISSDSINFLDFPVRVESIRLAHESGQTVDLSEGFSINLASLGGKPHYITTLENVPSGNYQRIIINLEFTQADKVAYLDTSVSDQVVLTHLISQTGKRLGVDARNFMINMPFYGKDLSVPAGGHAHLNVDWNLNASTEIMAPVNGSNEDWLVEFKPLVQAAGVSEPVSMTVAGALKSLSDQTFSIVSMFDGRNKRMSINKADLDRFALNGKEVEIADLTSAQTANSFVTISTQPSKNAQTFKAANLSLYEAEARIIEGVVVAKDERHLTIIGRVFSTTEQFQGPRTTFKLPTESLANSQRAYELYSSIYLKLTKAEFDQLTSSEGTLSGPLFGPEDEKVLPVDTEVQEEKKLNGINDKEDVFFLTVTEENISASSENSRQVTLLSNNGITSEQVIFALIKPWNTVEWEAGRLYHAKGYLKVSGNENVLVANQLAQVTQEAARTYKYQFNYDGDSWFEKNDDVHPTLYHKSQKNVTNIKELIKDKEAEAKLDLSSSLVLSSGLTLKDAAGNTISCSSIDPNLPLSGDEYQEGYATVVFELMQNNETWNEAEKHKLLNDWIHTKDYQGDYSKADLIYSQAALDEWVKNLNDVRDKKLLIHSLTMVVEPEEGKDLTRGGHCDVKPSYINVRWIREGTRLDAYRQAWKSTMRYNILITSGITVGGALVGAAALFAGYKLVDALKNKYHKMLSKAAIGYNFEVAKSVSKDTSKFSPEELALLNDVENDSEERKALLSSIEVEEGKRKVFYLNSKGFFALEDANYSDEAIRKQFGSMSDERVETIRKHLLSTQHPEFLRFQERVRAKSR